MNDEPINLTQECNNVKITVDRPTPNNERVFLGCPRKCLHNTYIVLKYSCTTFITMKVKLCLII